MDYVTRQFIELTKKFRKELRAYVLELKGALDEQTGAIRESAKTDQREQTPPPDVIVQVHQHFPDSIEINQKAKAAQYEWNYKFISVSVAAASVGIIVIYATLVYWQYREMIKATIATKQAVVEAKLNRRQAETAYQASVEQFHVDQRPWIGVVDSRIGHFAYHEDYIVEIQITNSGKQPALHAWYWNKSRVNPEPGIEATNMDDGKKHVALGSIPPNGPRIMRLIWKWDEWGKGYGYIVNRTSLISNYGEIFYYDAQGTKRKTQFCFFMKDAGLSSQRLVFCDQWNEMN
jgi:hypothetical protein